MFKAKIRKREVSEGAGGKLSTSRLRQILEAAVTIYISLLLSETT
jgi:hypothetical protein